jgi:hypothetical protein
MIASKGGLSLNILNKMGVRTKKMYLNALQDVHKKMNGVDDSDADNSQNMDTGGV